MEICYTDDCQKKEWLKLRQLRLKQVREQSKVIAQDVLRRSKEMQDNEKHALRIKRENILQEWKATKIQELEQKYNNAMEQVGLAIKTAQMEPEANVVLKEQKKRDDEAAQIRGKMAEMRESECQREAREKENEPVRRKGMIRDIEDIRSGLIVQCRDWNVINQTRPRNQQEVTLNVPATRLQDFQPREPVERLPFSASPATKQTSPVRANVSPKQKSSTRVTPYSSPKRSPLVPNLDDLKSCRTENQGADISSISADEPLVEFYDHQASYIRNYRLGQKLVARARDYQTESPPRNLPEEKVASEDEKLTLLLKKYSSRVPEISPPKEKTPVKKFRKCLKKCNDTPPTKENDFASSRTTTRRTSLSRIDRSKKTSCSTKKLLKTIDKALEESRKLRNEASIESISPSSSCESDSDSDAVVKLVVNVNCGQHGSPGTERADVSVKAMACQVVEPKSTCSVATEIGNSLLGQQFETDACLRQTTPAEKVKKIAKPKVVGKSVRKLDIESEITPIKRAKPKLKRKLRNDKCTCRQYGCCSKCNNQPMQRTSTFQNLAPKNVPETLGDVSSIYGEVIVGHTPDKSPPNKASEEKTSEMVNQSPVSPHSTGSGSATWCPTSYFSPPNLNKERGKQGTGEELKVNPVLDYYIRQLLDLSPDPCDSSRSQCTECRCENGSKRHAHTEELVESPIAMSENSHQSRAESTKYAEMDFTKGASIASVSDYEAETARRLERIAYLKQELEKIRMDKHLIESSSSVSSSSEGSATSHPGTNTQQRGSTNVPQPFLMREGVAHHLSTIAEVESRLAASSSESSVASDKVQQLIDRGIISSPFNWSRGQSLSDLTQIDGGASINLATPAGTELGASFTTLPPSDASQRPPLLDLSLSAANQSSVTQHFPSNTSFPSFGRSRREVSIDIGSPERDLERILANLNVSRNHFK